MKTKNLISTYLPVLEASLRYVIENTIGSDLENLKYMLEYHMGWVGENIEPKSKGKRIRPYLLLLTTTASGGIWEQAVPAASAIELIHNFSLIHDDIEDNSPIRRGRITLWKKWGIPLAINSGDTMFTLAFNSIINLKKYHNSDIVIEAISILQSTCLNLTQGQHLDIYYEKLEKISIDSYWPMVGGKTAALLSACTEIGSLVSGVDPSIQHYYKEFGRNLGLAFQAHDDMLGIWGDSELTGKSVSSDILERKKTLPILYGLEKNGEFAKHWKKGKIHKHDIDRVTQILENEGARDYTQKIANQLTKISIQNLEKAEPSGDAGEELFHLAKSLMGRED